MSKAMIAGFSILSVLGAGVSAMRWEAGAKAPLLPGPTTHGHYQIELSCESCHVPFGGVSQDACVRCHGTDLERSDDSHPAAKFSDPRNADRVASLNALLCVTCHVEHRPEITHEMGVTQPNDYCFHCHADIATERASHEGLAFDSCANAGCHNFHDNRALTTDFLSKRLEEPAHKSPARLPAAKASEHDGPQLLARDADAPASKQLPATHVAEWASSAHASGGVNCSGCHGVADDWTDMPAHTVCRGCHESQVDGFLSGHHGMRLAPGLSISGSKTLTAMTPGQARLPMRAEAEDKALGCQSCHDSHAYDRKQAAVDACLGCHADEHSLAYRSTRHFELWNAERATGANDGSGVSCASCHMPRDMHGRVEHNQNDNLRPNEKMVAVCAHCHGVGFTLDALADPAVIARGMSGASRVHVESLEMIRRQVTERAAGRANKPN